MDGDMRKDHLVSVFVFLYHVGTDIIYVGGVLFEVEDIVVTFYENQTSSESPKSRNRSTSNGNIAQQINTITRVDNIVMPFDKHLVMFFYVLEPGAP